MSEQVHGKHATVQRQRTEPNRDRCIQKLVRFAPDEWKIAKERYQAAKQSEPELSFQEYMLRFALRGKVDVLYVWDPTAIMTLIKRTANNINQVARQANTYGVTKRDAERMEALEGEMLAQVQAVSKDWWKLKATIHHERLAQDDEEG